MPSNNISINYQPGWEVPDSMMPELMAFLERCGKKAREPFDTSNMAPNDGILIFDADSGLEWLLPKEEFKPMSWDDAAYYAEELGNGWRLPTPEEVRSVKIRPDSALFARLYALDHIWTGEQCCHGSAVDYDGCCAYLYSFHRCDLC